MVTDSQKLKFKKSTGIISDDWDVDEIQNHANVITGDKNTQDRIEDGKFPFFVRSQIVERINSYSFDGEAVLTAGDGVGTGKVFHYINGKFDFHQRVYCINNFKQDLDGFFFYLYFSNYFLRRIMSMTAKSSVDSVRRNMISEMLIPLPEKNEQIAIATTLRDIIELIEFYEKIIAKKKNIRQGVMQELLTGKRRLGGFSGEWTTNTMEEIATFFSGGTPLTSVSEYYGGEIPWITSGDLNSRMIRDVEGRITKKGLLNSSAKMIQENTLLIALYGATAGTVAISLIKASINQAVLAIIPHSVDMMFLFHKLEYLKDSIVATYTQGGQPNLSSKIIKSIKLEFPSRPEQEAIANIITTMDLEIYQLIKQLDKYTELKQGMMQKLLTGEIRLT